MTLISPTCYNLGMEAVRSRNRKASTTAAISSHVIRTRQASRRAAPKRRKSLRRILLILRAQLPDFKARYPIKSLGIFGSYVRHDATPKSDLDVLIELDENARLGYGFIGIQNELSDLLGTKVDLIEKKTLKPRILENVMREVVHV